MLALSKLHILGWCVLGAAGLVWCSAAGAWTLKFDADGLRVYEREFAGARVPELMAVSELPAPLATCWNVIRDYERYPATMPYVKASRILKVDGDDTFYVYSQVDVNFPGVWMRDYAIKVLHESIPPQHARRHKTTWTLANEYAPPKPDDVVRIELNQGSWELTGSDDDARTLVVYQAVVDPGGSLPTRAVRWANTNALPKLFDALRKAVKDPRYQAVREGRLTHGAEKRAAGLW